MNKAVFLDRDGVINHPKKNYYVYRVEDFIFNPGVFEAMHKFIENDYLLIVISNQGGISKGKYSKQDVDRLHEFMGDELIKNGIYLTAVYYCAHHTRVENCLCRKPKPLMLQKAMARFDIDASSSWFIGDKKTDIEAGERAGVQTLKIRKNQNLMKVIDKII